MYNVYCTKFLLNKVDIVYFTILYKINELNQRDLFALNWTNDGQKIT